MLSATPRPSRFMTALFTLTVLAAFGTSANAQDWARPDGSVPLPLDWSTKHVLFTAGYTPEQAKKMENEPRAYASWLIYGNDPGRFRRHDHDKDPGARDGDHDKNPDQNSSHNRASTIKRDWAVSLGAGGVDAGVSPAKYNFDVNATPSCTADYAVFPIDAATGSSRANVAGTFASNAGSSTGSIVLSVTPAGTGTPITLTLNAITGSAGTGTSFEVFGGTGSTGNARTEAANLAAAINRSLSGNALGRIVAVVPAFSRTVTVYALTPGTRIMLSVAAGTGGYPANLSWTGSPATGGNGTQANIVALNNLYTGTVTTGCGTLKWPTFTFSYASGVSGVATSPSLSLDGTKVVYVENDATLGAILHVLTLGTGTEIGTCASNTGSATPLCATAPVIPGSTAGSNAEDFMLPLGLVGNANATTDTYSSPFVDFANDTAYVGDDGGYLYSITPVFKGSTPVQVWNTPIDTAFGGGTMASPVVDVSGTGNIFVGDSNGNLYNVSSAGVREATQALGAGGGPAIIDAPLIDSTNAVGYVSDSCNGFGGGAASEIYQFGFTTTAINTKRTVTLSAEGCAGGGIALYAPTPDNNYFNKGISSATVGNNGELIVDYASSGTGTAGSALAQFQFTSSTMNATAQYTNYVQITTGRTLSPPTEFYGSDVSYAVSNVSQAGGLVTVTTPANAFVTGQVVTIAGVTAGGSCNAQDATSINGQAYITVQSATQFQFTIGNSATFGTGNCVLTGATVVGPTKDYVFFGISQPEVFTYTLPLTSNTQTVTATETASVSGGTSGITIDNDSTLTQAASIYFGTLTTSTGECGTTVYCAVKLTQSTLQ